MNDNYQDNTTLETNQIKDKEVRDLLRECEELSSPEPQIEPTELQEVYQNAMLGKYAVEYLRPLSTDRGFRNLLLKQYKGYSAIVKEMENYADSFSIQLQGVNIVNRGMMYFSTLVNTIGNKSNSKLAEMMIQGINMGIISITKIINKKPVNVISEDPSTSFAEKMMEVLHANLEEMKLFL